MRVILASKSPRRIELMRWITEDFLVCPSLFDESGVAEPDPERLVLALAEGKARALPRAAQDIVIGCDTVVALDGRVFGKPKDLPQAREMIRALSGRTHSVLTGVCILCGGESTRFCSETKVEFYPLTEDEIERYIHTEEPYDKAGGYGIQERGGLFVRGICGDYNNVVGLPVSELARRLAPYLAGKCDFS
jgi:septum formation protein